MKKSLWQKDIIKNNFKTLNKDIDTDILIIGGGITGLTTAYNLLNKKYNITLLEADNFFNNTTCKSTGKLTYLQDLKYQDIYNIYDFKTTKLYYEAQKDGIKLAKKIIKENNIKCDLTKTDSITFTTSEKEVTKFDNEKKSLIN